MTATPSIVRSVRNQRRALMMAGFLVIAAIWISIPLGEWQNGLFFAIGLVLGAINHVLTEHVLLRSVEAGDLPTRKQYAASSLFRLLGVSGVAIALTAFFWPHGAAVLFGLAIFHLIALVLTGIPLLREVRKEMSEHIEENA
jgi:hypothetical protein